MSCAGDQAASENGCKAGGEGGATRAPAPVTSGRLLVGEASLAFEIRNISPRGIRIAASGVPPPGEHAVVEIRGLPPVPARIEWRRHGQAGLSFACEQNLDGIPVTPRRPSQYSARGPRWALRAAATLVGAGATIPLETIDISKRGLKLHGEIALAVGDHAAIRIDGYDELLEGRICWKNGKRFGLRFDGPVLRDDVFTALGCRGDRR